MRQVSILSPIYSPFNLDILTDEMFSPGTHMLGSDTTCCLGLQRPLVKNYASQVFLGPFSFRQKYLTQKFYWFLMKIFFLCPKFLHFDPFYDMRHIICRIFSGLNRKIASLFQRTEFMILRQSARSLRCAPFNFCYFKTRLISFGRLSFSEDIFYDERLHGRRILRARRWTRLLGVHSKTAARKSR